MMRGYEQREHGLRAGVHRGAGGRLSQRALAASVASLLAMPGGHVAQAFEFNTENSDLKARWDNTLKYSVGFRLKKPADTLTSISTPPGANLDDGDRNFGKGLISNRLDLLSEFDASYRHFGARISGAAWYDSVYQRTNDNDSPNSANAVSAPYNQFTSATKDLMGRRAEMLDA